MTNRTDFTQEEWATVLGGPPSAGLLVVSASRGGTFKETFAMSRAYAEARAQHGESELLDEIVSARPKVERPRAHSVEEIREHNLQNVRDAVALVERTATAEELEGYRRFVLTLARKVAEAHREHGVAVSEEEQTALGEIASSLGVSDDAEQASAIDP